MNNESIVTVEKDGVKFKDLLIPLAIVLAGGFVGTGLYLSGGAGQAPSAIKNAQPTADMTSKVDAVSDQDYVKGNRNAPIKIVEFSDFECPFCKRHHETLQAVVEKLGGDKIAWIYRHYPIEQLHPVKPMRVALAAECAGELGGNEAFWAFTDGYFEQTLGNNRTDIETVIPGLVTKIGLDKTAFQTCFDSERHRDKIQTHIDDAAETGGRGTPWSVVIGPDGKTYPINGSLPQAAIEQVINTALGNK